jgi:hypothetical protein
MEILILIAVIVTGASGLYVAYNFKNHIEKHVAPLMERIAQDARNQIEAASKELRQQVWTMTDGLRREIRGPARRRPGGRFRCRVRSCPTG